MNTVVIEHVPLDELPAAWRARLPVASNARVTVRIEEEVEKEAVEQPAQSALVDNPMFGMWRDREEGKASGEPRPFDAGGFKRRMLTVDG
jgi:hypothetical protein